MSVRVLPIGALVLLCGCVYNTNERADRVIADIARHPIDIDPTPPAKTDSTKPEAPNKTANPGAAKTNKDLETTNFLTLQTVPKKGALNLQVPEAVPGSEVTPFPVVKTKEELNAEIRRIFPNLPDLPQEPKAQPGPDGNPYTLTMLQEIAANNSPTLKQAVADVQSAEGALIQSRTYQNPNVGYSTQPSNNGETPGVHGIFLTQHIVTAGKKTLAIAAAQKDFDNAELALRKARSDLATQVRANYFGLLVAKESVRVNRGLAKLTDQIYETQLANKAFVAFYEAAALRAQANSVRQNLQISINNYVLSWKQLIYSMGVNQLPLSEVAGRIDVNIPYFDYDKVLAHVQANHTDVLIAQNTLAKSRYLHKLAQVTPAFPDFDLQLGLYKEFSLAPYQIFSTVQLSVPLAIWDRNKGNIITAEAGMVRASEEPHRASMALATNFQNAYNNYKNSLDSIDYYRRYILPDQVQAYRGVLARREIDMNAQFGDLVSAQQTLTTTVSSYLTTLGQLWSSSVAVADFLQTDDLFALAQPKAIPPLPDLEAMPPFPCTHPQPAPKPPELPKVLEQPLRGAPARNPLRESATPEVGPRLLPEATRREGAQP